MHYYAESRDVDKIHRYATLLPFSHMVWLNSNLFFEDWNQEMKKQIAIAMIALAASLGFSTSAMADINNGGNHHNDNSVNFTTTIVDIDVNNSTTLTAVDMGDIDIGDLDGVVVVQGMAWVNQAATSYAKGVDATAKSVNVGNLANVDNASLDVAVIQGAIDVNQTAIAGAMNCGSGCGSGTLVAEATNALNVATLTSIGSYTSVVGVQGSLGINQTAHTDSVAAASSSATSTNIANAFSVDFD